MSPLKASTLARKLDALAKGNARTSPKRKTTKKKRKRATGKSARDRACWGLVRPLSTLLHHPEHLPIAYHDLKRMVWAMATREGWKDGGEILLCRSALLLECFKGTPLMESGKITFTTPFETMLRDRGLFVRKPSSTACSSLIAPPLPSSGIATPVKSSLIAPPLPSSGIQVATVNAISTLSREVDFDSLCKFVEAGNQEQERLYILNSVGRKYFKLRIEIESPVCVQELRHNILQTGGIMELRYKSGLRVPRGQSTADYPSYVDLPCGSNDILVRIPPSSLKASEIQTANCFLIDWEGEIEIETPPEPSPPEGVAVVDIIEFVCIRSCVRTVVATRALPPRTVTCADQWSHENVVRWVEEGQWLTHDNKRDLVCLMRFQGIDGHHIISTSLKDFLTILDDPEVPQSMR
eukprot:GHVH01007023.1.p1 GENE.GHVH01007023.1~~GHVH01007023.1.p1  ORF type:complete len:409 (+),score=56.45 GHVH01007023.1:41-1267(+)